MRSFDFSRETYIIGALVLKLSISLLLAKSFLKHRASPKCTCLSKTALIGQQSATSNMKEKSAIRLQR